MTHPDRSPNALPPRSDTDTAPLSLLLDLSNANYWELMDEFVQACVEGGVDARVKVGLILPPRGRRSGLRMSRFHPGHGRSLISEEHSALPGQHHESIRQLLAEVTEEYLVEGFRVASVASSECVSFSSMNAAVAAQLISISRSRSALVAAWRWNSRAPHAGELLWRQLLLKRIVTRGSTLEDYEEFPDDIRENGDEFDWKPDRSPESSDGYFVEVGSILSVERALRHVPLPPDIATVEVPLPPPTPLQRAISAAGRAPVDRISGHDDASAVASYSLPFLHYQYPDLVATAIKVRDYCLDRSHPSQKWVGFMHHGYGLRETDSVVIAANICGALLGDFRAEESVATTRNELQFSVGISLPSSHRHHAPLTTAWIAEPDRGFRLTTAYIGDGRAEYAAAPRKVAPDGSLHEVWDEAVRMATTFAGRLHSDSVRARARVLIPRIGAANSLTRRLVREGRDHGTFHRTALGGRALLVPIGPETSWSAAAASASFVQVQLGLHGLLCMADVWVD